MIRKNKDVEFIVNEKTAEIGYIDTDFYTGDIGVASLRFRLKYKGAYINLSLLDMKPQLDLFHSDGSIWIDEELIYVFPEYGLVMYKIHILL